MKTKLIILQVHHTKPILDQNESKDEKSMQYDYKIEQAGNDQRGRYT